MPQVKYVSREITFEGEVRTLSSMPGIFVGPEQIRYSASADSKYHELCMEQVRPIMVCCCISVVFSSPCRSALDLEYSIHSSPRHSWKCMGTFLSSSSRWDHLQKTEFIWKSDHQCLALLRICSVRPYEDLANLMTPFNL